MAIATVVSVLAYTGWMGDAAQAFSPVISLATAFVTAPLIAWATRGRYYIARQSEPVAVPMTGPVPGATAADLGRYQRLAVQRRGGQRWAAACLLGGQDAGGGVVQQSFSHHSCE